jgi:hypothetical protein
MSKEAKSDFYCNKPSEIPCSKQCESCKSVSEKPLTEPMKSIEEEAEKANGYGAFAKGSEKYNAFNEGFKAGYELANSQTTNHLKWVLSSERLPQMEKFLVFKDNVGIYRTGNFYKDENKTVLSINETPMYNDFLVQEEHFNHYYWLEDFSASNPK